MLLMDIEKEIQPLSHSEKLQLMQRLAAMLLKEHRASESPSDADHDVQDDFQPSPKDVELLQKTAQEPYWPLYDQYDAAKTLLEVANSDLPAV